MLSQVRLRLLPSARCLFDEPVQLKVSGLRAQQRVTVRAAATDDKGVRFSSWAWYKADDGGQVDLHRDPSLGGSYVGLQPMGLLWSMRPDTLHRRFQKTSALQPHVVRFSVHEEEEGEEQGGGRMLAEATNERLLMAEGVARLPVKDGNIRGVLFTPPGAGPFPAVLDLYTLGGGVSEKRAALLASRGFVVLALALYGHDDLPKNVTELHLDYFEEAVEFLKVQNKVGSGGVGVISLSKSGDLALSMASHLAGVTATAWINGCSANTAFPLYYRKRLLHSALMFDLSKAVVVRQAGALMTKHVTHDPLAQENSGSLIPVEKAGGRLLLVASDDDLNWDSRSYLDEMAARLRRCGRDNFESVCYPGAGHFLEPPYGPYCPSSVHGLVGKPVLWGGEASAHAAAEVHLWEKVQEFFKTHLSCERRTGSKL